MYMYIVGDIVKHVDNIVIGNKERVTSFTSLSEESLFWFLINDEFCKVLKLLQTTKCIHNNTLLPYITSHENTDQIKTDKSTSYKGKNFQKL